VFACRSANAGAAEHLLAVLHTVSLASYLGLLDCICLSVKNHASLQVLALKLPEDGGYSLCLVHAFIGLLRLTCMQARSGLMLQWTFPLRCQPQWLASP
jgi:hypothetical protein